MRFFLIYIFLSFELLANTNYALEQEILDNPVAAYTKYQKRLKQYGANASFPEFKLVVDQIWIKLKSESIKNALEQNPLLKLEYNEVITYLAHLNFSFSYDNYADYPYKQAYLGIYPYRPTLEGIEIALRFFDKIERINNPKAVPLYHFDRYAYHKHALFADPEIVIIPSLKALSFSDLIRVRSVPIGLLGVSLESLRVDRYMQTPLDFWYHDLNHIRRLVAYIKLKTDKMRSLKSKISYYQETDNFIQSKIMPNIQKLPKTSSEQEIAIRRIIRLLFFEILHESAVAADAESILNDLIRDGSQKTPYELMLKQNISVDEIENLRTATGNVQSGATVLSSENYNNSNLHIKYYFDRDLGLLANVYNKLNFGYYDEPDAVNPLIVPEAYRDANSIALAAQSIFKILGASQIPSLNYFKELALSTSGKPELFNYKSLKPHESKKIKHKSVTEPLDLQQAVQEINRHKKSKKIFTIFGYSDLGYEDPKAVMQKITNDLMALDPNEYLILIGATEAGIGADYKIAKKLGFETLGLVSVKALSFSGKFSDYVDHIVIINENVWGGYLTNQNELSAVTKAYLDVSDQIAAYGGGNNTLATLQNAQLIGLNYSFQPAKMRLQNAQKVFANKNLDPEFLGGPVQKWYQSQCSKLFN